jgi:IS30 family transposase
MKYKQLSWEERQKIAIMRGLRLMMAVIARELGRHPSTVYREVKRNRSVHDDGYRGKHSNWKANGRRSRSRRNLQYGKEAFKPIEAMIRGQHSPEQIVGRRRSEGKEVMSHETIYKWIWADRRAGGTLWKHLRGARKRFRKRYGSYDSRGRLAGKKMIESRPAVVERRGRIGDWEIDTVHGSSLASLASVVTVVERRSGLVRIGKIERVTQEQTLSRTVSLLWKEKDRVRTITADNGTEFHNYKELERILGVEVYFATPHHAWERGSNENTNGLIRQYLRKGTDLSKVTQRQCNHIANKLNNRPRKRHGYKSPNEVYNLDPIFALQT